MQAPGSQEEKAMPVARQETTEERALQRCGAKRQKETDLDEPAVRQSLYKKAQLQIRKCPSTAFRYQASHKRNICSIQRKESNKIEGDQ
jgi:hypothetical protein